jgi:hypothetical protein
MTKPHQNWREAVEAARKPLATGESWQTGKLRDMLAVLPAGNDGLAYAMAQTTVTVNQAAAVARVISVMGSPAAATPALAAPTQAPAPAPAPYGNHGSALAAARQVGARLRGEKPAAAAKVEAPVSGPIAAARSLRGTFTRTSRMA